MVEFDQMWVYFHHSLPCCPHTSSIGVAAIGFPWYRSSNRDPQKVLNCSYDLIIGPILLPSQVFFHVREQKLDGAKSGEYGGWSTSSKPQSSTATIPTIGLCAGALSWWNRTPFVSFPGRSRNVSSTTFQSPELLIQFEFIWTETLQLVFGKVEFNACQVSFLWHGSFVVSVWITIPSSYSVTYFNQFLIMFENISRSVLFYRVNFWMTLKHCQLFCIISLFYQGRSI